MNNTGPVYCETGHPWLFVAEPVNTITNAVIILAAIFAYRHVRRETGGHPPDLMILVALLFATGLGSFAWHALRTRTALIFDFLPGVLFLLTFVFLWLRALYGSLAGAGALLFVVGAQFTAMRYAQAEALRAPGGSSPLLFVPLFMALAAIGAVFVALTWTKRGRQAALLATGLLTCAMLGALFRSIDLYSCQIVPFGTHFLWHIFLSSAAYLCIRFLTGLKVNFEG